MLSVCFDYFDRISQSEKLVNETSDCMCIGVWSDFKKKLSYDIS